MGLIDGDGASRPSPSPATVVDDFPFSPRPLRGSDDPWGFWDPKVTQRHRSWNPDAAVTLVLFLASASSLAGALLLAVRTVW